MTTSQYVVFSVVEAVLLVVVLVVALVRIRRRLTAIGSGLATLASVFIGIERDLKLLGVAALRLNPPLLEIEDVLPRIAGKAETVARG